MSVSASPVITPLLAAIRALWALLQGGFVSVAQWFRSSTAIRAENLFLRKQLALYQERNVRARRARDTDRFLLARLSRLFDWRSALTIVQPDTLVRWHRLGFRLLWRWRSRHGGRPPIPLEVKDLIRLLATENPTWGEDRIANEIRLKLGLRLSPRTIARYLPRSPFGSRPFSGQRWTTFVRNHARAVLATDFFTVVTATMQTLFVFIVLEVGSRRVLHCNVTTDPSSQWTMQQLREAIPCDHQYRFLIHDRDSVFSREVDECIKRLGIRPLKTPVRAPRANTFVERFGGSMRRECLDYLIPLSENHVRVILKEWISYYNRARPHMSLGPGIPDAPTGLPAEHREERHRIPKDARVVSRPVLGGLHHDYQLMKLVA